MKRMIITSLISLFLAVTLTLSAVPVAAAAPAGNWTDTGNYTDLTAAAANADRGGTSEADAYLIGTAEELAYLAVSPALTTGAFFKLTADIDISAHYWTPIGTSGTPFRGTLDGDGYIVDGVIIDTTATAAQGFIGYMSAGLVENIFVLGIDIDAPNAQFVGGMVGLTGGYASLHNCRTEGRVNGSRYVGGMVGAVRILYGSGTLNFSACVADVEVLARLNAGGFIGYAFEFPSQPTTISNCAALGDVTSTDSARTLTAEYQWEGTGGFIGQEDFGPVMIDRCYATGNVSGVNNVGGFVGLGLGGNDKLISNCYSSGTVSGDLIAYDVTAGGARRGAGNAGGFIGAVDTSVSDFKITSSYTISPLLVTQSASSTLPIRVGAFAGMLATATLANNHVTNVFFDTQINTALSAVGITGTNCSASDATVQLDVNPPQITGLLRSEMIGTSLLGTTAGNLNYDVATGSAVDPVAWFVDPGTVNDEYPVLACQTIHFTFSNLTQTYDGTAKQATVTQLGELDLTRDADWWVFYDNLKTPLPVEVGSYDVTVRIPGYVAIPPLAAVLQIVEAPLAYTIVASAGPGGSISPSGSVTVDAGANQGFSMAPSAGYKIKDVIIDGKSMGAATSVMFEDVSADHTIHVVFEKIAGDGEVPATGDSAMIATYSVLLFGALTLNATLVNRRRNRR